MSGCRTLASWSGHAAENLARRRAWAREPRHVDRRVDAGDGANGSGHQKEVLQLLAEGRSNKEVATLLTLGLSTVETHRANLMQKLNLHNTAEIVLYAVRKGLIV